jgi:putative transposase
MGAVASVGRKSEAPSAIFGCRVTAPFRMVPNAFLPIRKAYFSTPKCRYISAMPDYRRNRVPGGTYIFTVNLANRRSDLLVREVETLNAAIRAVHTATPFHIDAWVILPEHMHCIWTLPEDDTDYSGRWRAIKKRFSKALPNVEPKRPEAVARDGRGIWQKRFWEHTIRDDRDYRVHMDYVHFNPVKHGLVAHPADWPHSTFQKCVALGLYDTAWASPDQTNMPAGMGERA